MTASARISARVLDQASAPVPGVTVRFAIMTGPPGVLLTAAAVTDGAGNAFATLAAGKAPGACAVRAEAEGGNRPAGEVTIEIAPPAPHLSRNYFNPTRGERLRISVEVPQPARVAVRVVAMTGEVVREIEPGQLVSGAVVREWDGRAASGSRVPDGVYFVQVQSGESVQTRRVIVLKL